MITFGPVPSRRLGRSLGINHVPAKVCTYSCVYCQVGRTRRLRVQRRGFLDPERVLSAVAARVEAARRLGEAIDYLTFVPNGEPTLDLNLGPMIAVLTNASLLDRPEVRDALNQADLVSLKIDTVTEATWRRIDRPHGRLQLGAILEGMREFVAGRATETVTETMLVAGLNDTEAELRATASFVARLRPATAYVAVPTRPPAEAWVRPPEEAAVVRAHEIFRALAGHVELLVGYEGDRFTATGDPRTDVLATTAVHPLQETALRHLLRGTCASWVVVEDLLREGRLVEARYGGNRYFMRPPERARNFRRRARG